MQFSKEKKAKCDTALTASLEISQREPGQFAFQNCAWFTAIWDEPGAIPNEPEAIFKKQLNLTKT